MYSDNFWPSSPFVLVILELDNKIGSNITFVNISKLFIMESPSEEFNLNWTEVHQNLHFALFTCQVLITEIGTNDLCSLATFAFSYTNSKAYDQPE